MQSHNQLIKKLMRRPGVRAEVERLEREESALLGAAQGQASSGAHTGSSC